MSGEAVELFKPFIENGDVAAFATSLPNRLSQQFVATMATLRDATFQGLLVNYPRRRDSFVIAHGIEDSVRTEWFIRDEAGQELKPEDYLDKFARYVAENRDKITAISILLDRPREWGPQALSELRTTLAGTRERFTPDLLEKAHQIHYRKALVDIISMVKHAAKEAEPLLTAEERVARVFNRLTAGKPFTPAQQAWLERIRAHLVENLSIDREDFDLLPLFSSRGGWIAANTIFGGLLADLITDINQFLAA